MWVPVSDVVAGDVIEWAGRAVRIERVEPVAPRRSGKSRPATYLFFDAQDGRGVLRAHYYSDERVDRTDPT